MLKGGGEGEGEGMGVERKYGCANFEKKSIVFRYHSSTQDGVSVLTKLTRVDISFIQLMVIVFEQTASGITLKY